jgi:hypothetical protein
MISWTSTANFIQMVAFHANDTVIVNDLFGPSVGFVEKQRQRVAVDRFSVRRVTARIAAA